MLIRMVMAIMAMMKMVRNMTSRWSLNEWLWTPLTKAVEWNTQQNNGGFHQQDGAQNWMELTWSSSAEISWWRNTSLPASAQGRPSASLDTKQYFLQGLIQRLLEIVGIVMFGSHLILPLVRKFLMAFFWFLFLLLCLNISAAPTYEIRTKIQKKKGEQFLRNTLLFLFSFDISSF